MLDSVSYYMMRNIRKKTAVIITAYNRIRELDMALNTLEKSDSRTSFDIYVTDNGSSKDIRRVTNQHPKVIYVRKDKNTYVSHAINYTFFHKKIERKYEYVVFLADDALVEKQAIKKLTLHLTSDSLLGITAPCYYEYANDIAVSLGASINRWTSLLVNHSPKNPQGANHFISCYALPTQLFARVGGLDHTLYPMIFEEPDLGERVKAMGYEIYSCERAKMWHPIDLRFKLGSQEKAPEQKHRLYNSRSKAYLFFRNRIIYMSKYSNFFQFLVFYAVFNPLIFLYYLPTIDPKHIPIALVGMAHGTIFALTKSRTFIARQNQAILGI